MRNHKGFTLLEMLIVIAIISIIIGVLLPNYNSVRMKSRDQARKAGVKAIAEALELYKLNQNPPTYPTTFDVNKLNVTPGQPWQVSGVTYTNHMPKDPLFDIDPDLYYFRYGLNGGDTLKYYIGACLEDRNDPEGVADPDSGSIFTNNTTDCPSQNWYYKIEP